MLLVVIIIPLLSTQIKSAIVLDLIILSTQLMLTMYLLELLTNYFAILLFIGMMTCFLDGLLVVMLIFGLTFSFKLFMTFWISSIFLLERLGNISLIFNVSLTIFFGVDGFVCLDGEVAFAYDFFCWKLMFFLKYLDNPLTSFCDLAEIRGGIKEIKVGFTTSLSLLLFTNLETWGVNLDFILFLNIVLLLSMYRPSQCKS